MRSNFWVRPEESPTLSKALSAPCSTCCFQSLSSLRMSTQAMSCLSHRLRLPSRWLTEFRGRSTLSFTSRIDGLTRKSHWNESMTSLKQRNLSQTSCTKPQMVPKKTTKLKMTTWTSLLRSWMTRLSGFKAALASGSALTRRKRRKLKLLWKSQSQKRKSLLTRKNHSWF